MRTVRIGIVGFGAVGRATANILSQHSDSIAQRSDVRLEIAVICRRSGVRSQDIPTGARVVTDWRELISSPDAEIVVEVMGGTDESLQLVRGALENGKPVVTANKNLLAQHGDAVFSLAASKNLPIGFEGAVASSIPVIRVMHESTASDELSAVYGILNGTANYILTQMEKRGIEFDEALKEAQKKGYAEADPSLDIDGVDSRDKLCILSRMAFGGKLNVARIVTRGIRQICAADVRAVNRRDGTIRLIGSAERTESGLEVSVCPWMISRHSMLARVQGVNNAVLLKGSYIGTQMLYGLGAGGDSTGAVVVSDLMEIARDLAHGQLRAKNVPGFGVLKELQVRDNPRPVRWYLGLKAKDQRGIFARVAEVIAGYDIHIESLEKEADATADELSFDLTVEPVPEPQILQAVAAINALDFIVKSVLLLRIE